jgi:hypothetical protein
MTRTQRLRRVVLLCCHSTRNLAYYRVGWRGGSLKPNTEFWRTVNGNCLDQCVLEWCKLFGEKQGEHYWARIVSDAGRFEAELLRHLNITADAFESYRIEMRDYRDEFIAHLDSQQTMTPPKLDIAKTSVNFYHGYLVNNEVQAGDLSGLPDTPTSLSQYYQGCEDEAGKVYRKL